MRMARAGWHGILLAMSITLGSALQAADPPLRLLELKHRLASETVDAVRPLLRPGEQISAVDNKLILRASPETVKQIERLLAAIDVPRRNLRIRLRVGRSEHVIRESAGASGSYRDGRTRIVVGGEPSRDGVHYERQPSPTGIAVGGERRISTRREDSTQTITVLDGGRAFLRVGASIPQVEPYLVYAARHGRAIVAGVRYIDVTTGFEVEPRTVGDKVRLAVSPRLAFRGDRGTETIHFQELRTEVSVVPGEWTDLAGVLESAHDLNRRILGGTTGSLDERSVFLVRVDPL